MLLTDRFSFNSHWRLVHSFGPVDGPQPPSIHASLLEAGSSYAVYVYWDVLLSPYAEHTHLSHGILEGSPRDFGRLLGPVLASIIRDAL